MENNGIDFPLHRAAGDGDLGLVKSLVAEGAEVNVKNKGDCTPPDILVFQKTHVATKTIEEKFEICAPCLMWAVTLHQFQLAKERTEKGVKFKNIPFRDIKLSYFVKVINLAGAHVKMGGDIVDFVDFFVDDDWLSYDEAAVKEWIADPPEAIPLLRAFRDELAMQKNFSPTVLEKLMQRFIEVKQIDVNQIIHALRVAVTGKSVGLGMFETLEILGKKRVLRRIDRALL